jgi:hypothetical protein
MKKIKIDCITYLNMWKILPSLEILISLEQKNVVNIIFSWFCFYFIIQVGAYKKIALNKKNEIFVNAILNQGYKENE